MKTVSAAVVACLMIVPALPMTGCRIGPVDPKPQDFTNLEDRADRGRTSPPRRVEPATVTPREAYEAFRDVIAKADYDACWPLLSKRAQDDFERVAAEFEMELRNRSDTPQGAKDLLDAMKLSAEEVRKSKTRLIRGPRMMAARLQRSAKTNPRGFQRIARSQYLRDEIHEDRAQVYLIMDRKIQKEPMPLVREGTLWKIDLNVKR